MAETNANDREVTARLVYWGIEGAGKSANLRAIHSKLRPDHRGALRSVPTALDPTVAYEVLPIELGEISGLRTRIETYAVPGSPEHAPTRKQLLDQVDGVVFVIDSRRDQIDANIAAFEELRGTLGAYGRSLEQLPLVLQYNKRDVSDPYALEELHRKLDVSGAAAFEAVASEGTGVIETLTTISKRMIRALRERGDVPGPDAGSRAAPEPAPEPAPAAAEPEPAAEAAAARTEARAREALDASWSEVTDELTTPPPGTPHPAWRILAAGTPRVVEARLVELPLRLELDDGREARVRLRVALEPDDDGGAS